MEHIPVVKNYMITRLIILTRDVLRAIQDSTSYNVDNKEINGYITQEMKGSLQIENSE